MYDKIIRELQSMREDDFTKSVIMKLFEKAGYSFKFNGGKYEKGKDLICWKHTEFDDIEFVAIQVKMEELNARSYGFNAFSSVANQLAQAKTIEIYHTDGVPYFAKHVYFVSPQTVNERALQQQFKLLLNQHEVKIFDLPKLKTLFEKYNMWDYLSKLCNEKLVEIEDVISANTMNNDELGKALAYANKLDAELYYSDLDISYLNNTIKLSCINDGLIIFDNELDYFSFKTFIQNRLELMPFFDFQKIEDIYKKSNLKNNLDNIEKIKKTTKKLQDEILLLEAYFDDYEVLDEKKHLSTVDKVKKHFNGKFKDNIEILLKIDIPKKIKNNLNLANNEIENLSDSIKHKANSVEKTTITIILKSLSKLSILVDEIVKLKNATIEIRDYHFKIHINEFETSLNKILSNIVQNINQKGMFVSVLKNIQIFRDMVFDLSNYLKTFRIEYIKQNGLIGNNDSYHICDILDNGISIILEAQAGSGKTTSLQHYSIHGNKSLIKVYLPLAKILSSLDVTKLNSYEKQKNEFYNAICTYFSYKNNHFTFTRETFQGILNNKNTILLFDGYDEIHIKAPWVLDLIQEIKSTHDLTIVISSRPSYINSIRKNFAFIRLKSFNDNQRNKFIRAWFKDSEELALRLITHIEKFNLQTLINNPMAATIFCRLLLYKHPLPKTEVQMYENRFNLLFGEYDKHKDVQRNEIIKTDLEAIAIKIAYIFHKNNTRSMAKMHILEKLKAERLHYSEEDLSDIVNELISPCDVLFDEFNDDKFTFGHLRYQEYLVARELQKNRGIVLSNFLDNKWWKGAFILFSQMTDNLKSIIEDIIEREQGLGGYHDALCEMIEIRSDKAEKEILLKIINKYKKLDDKDNFY